MNRRVWNEVTRVIETSDIVFLVLDIRNPIGTWSDELEKKIIFFKKKMVLILNKCDLVPKWIISKWLKIFSKKNIVVAFHCNTKNPLGKSLIFRIIKIMKDKTFSKKQKIVIGIVGYPNVGKSSIINTLKRKKVAISSPIPGQTKTLQFFKLFKNIFLIDSPGIIQNCKIISLKAVLGGEIRIKKKQNQFNDIGLIKKMVGIFIKQNNSNSTKITKISKLNEYETYLKLEKGGKMNEFIGKDKIISDFVIGNIPWYSPIPSRKKRILKFFSFPWIF